MTGKITGREPRLSVQHSRQGERRLSLRNLATMLNMLPPEQISLDVAEAALRSDAFFVRYNAAVMLAKRADRDARLIMEKVLNDGEAPSRATVARHLHGFSWFTAEPLLRQALTDSDSRVREGAVYALCDLRHLDAFHLLTEQLQQETDTVRSAAAWGLRDCGDPAAVPVLEAVMGADDPDVRASALEALGANASPQAVPIVHLALFDPDPDVQYAATLSLLELVGEGAVPELAALIRGREGKSRAALLRGLFHGSNYLGIPLNGDDLRDKVLDVLADALRDSDEVRSAAVWLLAWIRHVRADALLREAYFAEADEDVKAHILRVAVSLMAESGDAMLADAQHSDLDRVREAAGQILRERIGRIVPRYDDSDTQRHGLFAPHLEDPDDLT